MLTQMKPTLTLRAVVSCLLCLATCVSQANDLGLVAHAPAEGRSVATQEGHMVAYEETLPGTDVRFTMMPIPGGEFLMGSPEDEPGREASEGPLVRVRMEPMWVGECEVTWAEYRQFMRLYEPFKKLNELRYYYKSAEEGSKLAQSINKLPALKEYLKSNADVDAVTCPTPLYDSSYTYESGEEPSQPAVTMTQFAAKQYTKWLSGVTQRQYRLPTEAEWEYATRAGKATPYSFGEGDQSLAEHAWYEDNSDGVTHPVGKKHPNAWGLHDTHGNVSEWVLDQFDPAHYATIGQSPATAANALRCADQLYPRAYRGGCWYDTPDRLRSAARGGSDDEEWTLSDPNLPISPWWYTEYEAQGVGFRVVRPLAPMDEAQRKLAWNADIDAIRFDVSDRLAEGRGARAPANPRLSAALAELQESREQIDTALGN